MTDSPRNPTPADAGFTTEHLLDIRTKPHGRLTRAMVEERKLEKGGEPNDPTE